MTKAKTVLILYPEKDDLQSAMLYEELLKQGLDVLYLPFRCDSEESCSKGFCYEKGVLHYLGYNLNDLKAVYIRALAFSLPADMPAYLSRSEHAIWRAKFIQETIRFSSLFSMLNILKQRGVIIINHPHAYYQHNSKAQFFSILRTEGFSVPEFISTNDYRCAKNFCAESECVCKSAYGVGATRPVNKESMSCGCGLKKTPAVFQKKLKGDTIRVHTVGTRAVLSLKILSEGIDSRSDPEGFSVVELPGEIESEISSVNCKFNAFYSAWDIIKDENGRYHLLDFNPGPYIGWIGDYFTRYVMSALAQFIQLHETERPLEQISDSLRLPNLEFTQVLVNSGELTNDYKISYRSSLRIRH